VIDDDDLVAAGLYDPTAPDAGARLELLRFLLDEVGASLPEVVQASEEELIVSFAAFRQLRPVERCTFSEAAARAAVDPTFAARIWRAAGFADPRPFERRFGERDVRMFATLVRFRSYLSDDQVVQLARALGAATSQIAEAEIALLRSSMEAPLHHEQRFVDIARTYHQIAQELFPFVGDAIDTLHRHHLDAIGRRYAGIGAPTTTNIAALAVGFADLSDYTGLSSALDAEELGHMIDRFEATTGDVVAAAGAQVAKRIGDAVMFVSNAPGVACELALDLVDACAAALLPKLRVGIAFGDVIARHGDFFGPTVNLASRLVGAADAGTVLTDTTLHDRLSRVPGRYAFVPAGRLALQGFGPVAAYQLLRGGAVASR
jgi:class 3 adenylate cyclase